jgi:hypothetical protein
MQLLHQFFPDKVDSDRVVMGRKVILIQPLKINAQYISSFTRICVIIIVHHKEN